MKIDNWDKILNHALKCGYEGVDGIVQSAYSVGHDTGYKIGFEKAQPQENIEGQKTPNNSDSSKFPPFNTAMLSACPDELPGVINGNPVLRGARAMYVYLERKLLGEYRRNQVLKAEIAALCNKHVVEMGGMMSPAGDEFVAELLKLSVE